MLSQAQVWTHARTFSHLSSLLVSCRSIMDWIMWTSEHCYSATDVALKKEHFFSLCRSSLNCSPILMNFFGSGSWVKLTKKKNVQVQASSPFYFPFLFCIGSLRLQLHSVSLDLKEMPTQVSIVFGAVLLMCLIILNYSSSIHPSIQRL